MGLFQVSVTVINVVVAQITLKKNYICGMEHHVFEG